MHVLQSRVLLRPADMDAAIAFYEDQLGLVRYREWGDAPHRGVVYFLGGGYLELTEGGGQRPAGFRLWLQVGDASAAAAELTGKGVDIPSSPTRMPWGLIEFSVHDPDGVELVVVETPIDHPLRRRE